MSRPRVGVRELRQNLSVYLRQVTESGEALEVTDRGRPVALLTPLPSDSDPIARLEAEGRIVWRAKGDLLDLGPPLEPEPGQRPLSEILEEMRSEER